MRVRSIGSGGESLGESLLEWGRHTFSTDESLKAYSTRRLPGLVDINEFYGQTECNLVLGSCSLLHPIKPGSIGLPIPGHGIELVDDQGRPVPREQEGQIAVRMPHPVSFLRYLNAPQATLDKFVGERLVDIDPEYRAAVERRLSASPNDEQAQLDMQRRQWLVTGDMGRMDQQGYVSFVGRADDVFKVSGYRCGPVEIEECLLKNSSVAMCAVIGVPDEQRGQVPKAFVVVQPSLADQLVDDAAANARFAERFDFGFLDQSTAALATLRQQLIALVKQRLAPYEQPRHIEFVRRLPMTNTGKVQRRFLKDLERARAE